jgi:hypothetical protein
MQLTGYFHNPKLESTRTALLWMSGQDGPQGGENQIGWTHVNYNAEAQAIIEAIKITRRWAVDKRIIMTDCLNNIVAQEETFSRGNNKKMVLKELMTEKGSNLKLMWLLAHVGK